MRQMYLQNTFSRLKVKGSICSHTMIHVGAAPSEVYRAGCCPHLPALAYPADQAGAWEFCPGPEARALRGLCAAYSRGGHAETWSRFGDTALSQ